MAWRLRVVDGADTHRFFTLPEAGSRVIGNSHKHADICLNDLYVGRVHCQVDTTEGRVTVTAMADDRDTLLNGEKVAQSEMQPGAVLRVGNSHLRLEAHDAPAPDEVEEAEIAEPDELPDLEWEQLEQLAGRTMAHFQIGQVLGRGHYGVIFRVHDTETRRDMALKVIGADFPADTAELQRFARAIKAVATIQDDHLVRWYAAGKTQRYVWIAQELVEGESLAQILSRSETMSKVRWRNALKLAVDIGKALDGLYQRRIVHGNVTPANVLIAVANRTAKLNDLMFEQALKGSAWHNARLEEKLLSELPYLPPERVEPGQYWDNIADIYSLGAVTYARLTGGPPFQGSNPGETIDLIRAGKPEKPRRFFKDIPPAFETIVLKMLAPRQEDRYQTPAQLLEDLERCQTLA